MEPNKLAPLLVIVGETASGKTALSLSLAKELNGEVICADSRTVYKGMDIGTAKPSTQARQGVAHHLIDIVYPDEAFNVSMFKEHALAAITEIHKKRKLPILVGGSGLYVNALIYDYSFRKPTNSSLRNELESLSVEQLQVALMKKGVPLPNNHKNPRHLIRILESGQTVAQSTRLPEGVLVIGLRQNVEVLRERIADRANEMLKDGLLTELEGLHQTYGWDIPSMQAPAYKSFRGLIEGTKTKEQSLEDFITADLRLAKKQRTWFKRDRNIIWCDTANDATTRVEGWLSTFAKQYK